MSTHFGRDQLNAELANPPVQLLEELSAMAAAFRVADESLFPSTLTGASTGRPVQVEENSPVSPCHGLSDRAITALCMMSVRSAAKDEIQS